MSHQFQTYLLKHGILSQRLCPYTPQQNGVAERKNRHLLDTVRSLLLESSVPAKFWPEALATAVHLINRLPSHSFSNQTPYFHLFHKDPTYTHLRIFGCVFYSSSFHLNVHNELCNQLNVRSLAMLLTKKGISAMIMCLTASASLKMLYFSKTNGSFLIIPSLYLLFLIY